MKFLYYLLNFLFNLKYRLRAKIFDENSVTALQNSMNLFLEDRNLDVEHVAYSVARGLPPKSRPENHYCILLYRSISEEVSSDNTELTSVRRKMIEEASDELKNVVENLI